MSKVFIAAVLTIASSLGQVKLNQRSEDFCRKILAREKIQPNLEIHKSVHLFGTITDFSGETIRNSPVELRKYVSQDKQLTLKVVSTDANGHFDLGTVKPGKYRLLPYPTRAFQQPAKLDCPFGENSCDLKIDLRANATDQPDSVCPIQ